MKNLMKNAFYDYVNRKNPDHFYGEFILGGLNVLERKILDLKNKQVTDVIKTFSKPPILSNDATLQTFISAGILIWEAYFEDLVDEIKSLYSDFFKGDIPQNEYKRLFSLELPDYVLRIILDDRILDIFNATLGGRSYLRASPGLNITKPLIADITSRQIYQNKIQMNRGFASVWHRDTPLLLQFHILLRDTDYNDPHMLFAKGSHLINFGRFANFASEEYVKDNFEIIHCIGKKGTVYLFNGGSGLHRMMSSTKGQRETMEVLFTAGNNLLVDSCPIKNITTLNLGSFSQKQIDCLKYFLH